MNRLSKLTRILGAAAFAWLGCVSAHSASIVITNGGFEAGLAGWTRADQLGSDGTFFSQIGSASPVNGDPVPPPPQGLRAAMTDAGAGGSHVLYQAFLVPASSGTTFLNFDVFIGNRADRFATPDTLDWATAALNQQARVDLLLGAADPFSVQAADVVFNAFRTNVGDPLVSGYTHFSVDVTAALNQNAGGTLLLRFAEVDNVGPLQLGVDDVSFTSPAATGVPEPASLLLLLAACIAAYGTRRTRS